MEKLNLELLNRAYNGNGELVGSVNRTEIIMKNFKALVKSTTKTQEVLCTLFPVIDCSVIGSVIKDLKDNNKGTKDNYAEILKTVEEKLVDMEKGYNIMRTGTTVNNDIAVPMLEYRSALGLSLATNGLKDDYNTAVNNPLVLIDKLTKDNSSADQTVEEAIITVLMSFASRGYSNLSDLTLLVLEKMILLDYANKDVANVESIWNFRSIEPFLNGDENLIDLTIINSVGAFSVEGKALIPNSILLDILFESNECMLTLDELVTRANSSQIGVSVNPEIVSYFISRFKGNKTTETNEVDAEMFSNNPINIETGVMEDNPDLASEVCSCENVDCELKDEKEESEGSKMFKSVDETLETAKTAFKERVETLSEAASKAYETIKDKAVKEAKVDTGKVIRTLQVIGVASVCAIGGYLAYKKITK